MSVCFVVKFTAKDETYADLKATMKAILPDTAARDGAELISAAADDASNNVTIWEVWDKVESQQAYIAWRTERGDIEKLGALLAAPPVFEQQELVF